MNSKLPKEKEKVSIFHLSCCIEYSLKFCTSKQNPFQITQSSLSPPMDSRQNDDGETKEKEEEKKEEEQDVSQMNERRQEQVGTAEKIIMKLICYFQ